MTKASEDKIIEDIRREERRKHARRTNPRAKGLIEGNRYRHKVNGDVYILDKLSNLSTTKPGWDVQVFYYPVGDEHNGYSRHIDVFLEKFEEV